MLYSDLNHSSQQAKWRAGKVKVKVDGKLAVSWKKLKAHLAQTNSKVNVPREGEAPAGGEVPPGQEGWRKGLAKFIAIHKPKDKGEAPAKPKDKACKGPSGVPEPCEEWPGGDFLGHEVRCVCESLVESYQRVGRVLRQKDDLVQIELYESWSDVVTEVSKIERHPPLYTFTEPKRTMLPAHELDDLCLRFPELDELAITGPNSRLTGEHVLIGSWMLERDLNYPGDFEMVAPAIVACHAGSVADKDVPEEHREKAKKIILRKFESCGILGFPIFGQGSGAGEEHWTLLIVRRSSTMKQARC